MTNGSLMKVDTTCGNIGLVLIVEVLPLKDKTLDLILTNRLNKVLLVDALPGVSYLEYVDSIVTPQELENEYADVKVFGTYIKHRRSDNVGVSSRKNDGKL